MSNIFPWLLAGALGATGCQSAPEQAAPPATAEAATPATASAIATEAEALRAVDSYLQEMPEGGEYNFDSARVMPTDANWLVLVPSLPGDGRKPNTAAFTVDRHTGDIQVRFVPRAGQ